MPMVKPGRGLLRPGESAPFRKPPLDQQKKVNAPLAPAFVFSVSVDY